MSGLRLSNLAEADLDELWAYIAGNNQDAADRIVEAILASARLHVRFPDMGQNRPELGANYRGFAVPPYVVIYREEGEHLTIYRVVHSARDIDRLFNPPN